MNKNHDLFERSLEFIPGGVNSPVRAFNSVGGKPIFFKKGKGSRLWDENGKEYIDYINLMEEIKLELAGEYLLMAAMLAEIKSRMLLPRPEVEEDEEDPRAELVRRLQEYERFKMAAEDLDAIPRLERDIVIANVEAPEKSVVIKLPDVTLKELLIAFHDVLKRVEMNSELHFEKETLSVKQRMLEIINRIQVKKFIDFVDLFSINEGRLGIAVTFLAILELLKDATIEVVQNEEFAPMHIRVSSAIHINED